jgi:outer membrane protein insertion porin family
MKPDPRLPGLRAACRGGLLSLTLAAALPAAAQQIGPPSPTAQVESDPTIVALELRGQRRYSSEQILATLALAEGQALDPEQLRRGIEALWRTLRIRCQVDTTEVPGGVRVRLTVRELELDLAPRFIGNEKVSTEKLLEWAGLEEDSEVYLFQAESIARRIESQYLERGYAFASVRPLSGIEGRALDALDAAEEDEESGFAPEASDLIFDIHEGPRVRVERLEIVGNSSLPDRGWWLWATGLRASAKPELRSPYLFGLFPKYFDRRVLDEDLVALAKAYRDKGYLNAIVRLERLEFNADRSRVVVHIVVDEGPRFTVSSIGVQGYRREVDPEGRRLIESADNLAIPEAELIEGLELSPGQPFLQELVDLDEAFLKKRYGQEGFVGHESIPVGERFQILDPELTFDETTNEVAVVYRIAQGQPQYIREVRFAGNQRTRDDVLRREVSVFPGELADMTQIDRSLARLRGTGYFSTLAPSADHIDPYYRFVETDDPATKDIEFVVEEGDAIRIDLGVQFGTDNGFAGQIGFRFINFDISRWPSWEHPFEDIYRGRAWRGAGQTFEIFASPGTEVSRYAIEFTEPDLFDRHLDRIGGSVDLNRRLRIFQTHREERDSVGLRLFKQLDPDTSASVGFRHTQVEISNLFVGGEPSLIDPLSVPDVLYEQLGKSRIVGIETGLNQRKLDNAMAPRDGYSWGLGADLFTRGLGSDYDYVNLDGRFDQYGYLFRTGAAGYRWHLQAGVGVPFADTDNVPFSERFFLGGSRILRGFDFRGVGPTQRGFAIGGETMLASSLDLLWPLLTTTRPGDPRPLALFRAGPFLDVGLLDPDPFQANLSELRASLGWSFSMAQPMPLALNFGWPLLSEPGDDRRVFSFAISY